MRCTRLARLWRRALCREGVSRCCLKIVMRSLEEPLRRIVINAAEEPSIVLHRVDESDRRSFGYNAATREYGDMLEMGVIDPAKVTRLALQNAGSIASLILTVDCLIADAQFCHTFVPSFDHLSDAQFE